MSDIGEAKTLMLTATKGSRKPHKVLPLIIAKTKELDPANPSEKWVGGYIANLTMFETMPELDAFVSEKAVKLAELQEKRPDLYDMVSEAISERVVDLAEPAKEPVG